MGCRPRDTEGILFRAEEDQLSQLEVSLRQGFWFTSRRWSTECILVKHINHCFVIEDHCVQKFGYRNKKHNHTHTHTSRNVLSNHVDVAPL